jgi:sec-independent protein translocase protein TatC
VSQPENSPETQDTEAGFITHLLELRDRLLRTVIFLVVIFAIIFPFANEIYHFLATPLLAHMPTGSSMIAVEVISPFLTPLKMAMYASLLAGMPYLLYQMWAFVAPGLYQHEKRLAMPLLISSIILFYAGVAFAYFVVFPLVFNFLVNVAPEGVAVMTDINKYLDFVLALFFAFGLAFEVPVATIILIAMGITTADSLVTKRPYIIVGAFVIGMLLTPPDVISQVMLALPMWALFEAGIIMSRILIQPSDDEEQDEDEAITPASAGAANTTSATTGAAAATSGQTASASNTPKSYTAPAYPDDYKPLTWEEMEAEIDEASRWEEPDADDDSEEYDKEYDDESDWKSDDHDEVDEESETDDTEQDDDGYVKRDDDIGP